MRWRRQDDVEIVVEVELNNITDDLREVQRLRCAGRVPLALNAFPPLFVWSIGYGKWRD